MQSKQIARVFIFLALSTMFIACSDTEPKPEPVKSDLIKVDYIVDVRNAGNASDISMKLTVINPTSVSEFRFFLSRIGTYQNLTTESLGAIPLDHQQTVQVNGAKYEISPEASLVDLDGDPIQSNVDYIVGFATVVDGVLTLDKNNGSVMISDEHYLVGDFIGTWNDNLYVDFAISARLSFVGGKLTGPFFYSGGFVSCCSGQNDGVITVEFNDDQEITDFKYNQHLASFMGGECPGLYEGEGMVVDFTTLRVEFTGADCEGPHTDGVILLRRLN